MKIKSLLAAVSMVALTAGTASALTIPVNIPATGTTPAVMPANALSPEGAVLANELALPADGIGNVTFTIMTESGNYPAGNNFIVNVALPTGVEIDGPISGSVLQNVSLDGAVVPGGSAVVQSQDGSNIQLFVSIPQGGGEEVNELNFAIPLSLASCDVSGGLEITVATEGGTPVEDGVASAPSPIAPCESAFDTTFETDITATGANDSIIGLTDYELLRDFVGAGLSTATPVGLFSAEIDPTVGIDLAGTALTPASIDEITVDIVLEDGEDFTGITINGVAGTQSADDNTFSFDLPFTANVIDAPIIVTVDGTEVIPSQNVLAADVVHDFTDAGGPDLIGSEAGSDAALDRLQREGQAFGFFDWNSGGAGAQTVSVYRVTGLTPGETVPFTATLENSNANGDVAGSVTADATGEAVIFSTDLAGALPAGVVRYDFQINFETGNDVDVDRLLVREGIVTSFGDGANSNEFGFATNQPVNDSDNFSE